MGVKPGRRLMAIDGFSPSPMDPNLDQVYFENGQFIVETGRGLDVRGTISQNGVAVSGLAATLSNITIIGDRIGSAVLTDISLGSYISTNGSINAPMITGGTFNGPTLINATINGGVTNAKDAGAQVFNILAYSGALVGTINTAQITAACSAAYAASGGFVYIPPGTWWSTPFELGNHVKLKGAGMFASVLKCVASQNTHFIKNHQSTGASDPYGRFCGVFDLSIDGNASQQPSGNHGIFWNAPNTTVAADDSGDQWNICQNVLVKNTSGDGFAYINAGENRYLNCYADSVNGNGFNLGFDLMVDNCTAGNTGQSGFLVAGGSSRYSNCKAFGTGRLGQSTGGQGAGFQLVGASDTGLVKFTNCEAQDAGGHGWSIVNQRNVSMVNCGADSCGWGNSGSLATPGAYVGLDMFNVNYCMVVGFQSQDRGYDHGAGGRVTQQNALQIRGTSAASGSNYNYIQLTHAGQTRASDASLGAPVAAITNTFRSTIIANGNTAASSVITTGSAYLYTTLG